MYTQRNTEARSPTHYCCGKAISITYYECVFVAKYPFSLSDFNDIWFFFDKLSKNSQILNLMKVPRMEGELCHAGGQT